MKKILILGINGFTGRNVIEYIEKNNLTKQYEIIGIDRDTELSNKKRDVKYFSIDLLNAIDFENIILKISPQYIMNLVGTFHNTDYSMMEINWGIPKNIFDILIRNKLDVNKILLLGSAAEYGYAKILPVLEDSALMPVNIYGLSKLIQTNVASYYYNNYKLNICLARSFNLIGPFISKELSIGAFYNQILNAKNNQYINVGNVKSKRDFIDINDAIDAYFKILIKGKPGEIYNVCSGKSVSIEYILSLLIKYSGKKLKLNIKSSLLKNNDVSDIYGSNIKLKNELNWNMKITISESIKRLWKN